MAYLCYHSSSVSGVLLGRYTITLSRHPPHSKGMPTNFVWVSSTLWAKSSSVLIAIVKKI